MAIYLAHEARKERPSVAAVPVPLPDKKVTALNGLILRPFDYSLQVPWTDKDFERDGNLVTSVHFKSGVGLIIFNPLTAPDFIKEMRKKGTAEARKLKRLFGDRAVSSNYDLWAAEMAATPEQIKWWAAPGSNIKDSILLNLKWIEISPYLTAIYLQSSDEMHGFQFGSPAIAPFKVGLELFDRNDRRYEIIIAGKDPTHPIISQEEINAMVASLRPIPHSLVFWVGLQGRPGLSLRITPQPTAPAACQNPQAWNTR
jgi:hypothetical protein